VIDSSSSNVLAKLAASDATGQAGATSGGNPSATGGTSLEHFVLNATRRPQRRGGHRRIPQIRLHVVHRARHGDAFVLAERDHRCGGQSADDRQARIGPRGADQRPDFTREPDRALLVGRVVHHAAEDDCRIRRGRPGGCERAEIDAVFEHVHAGIG
jgi:hypothetical protein